MPIQEWVQPVVLDGPRVRLEPLRLDHLADLARVAFDLPSGAGRSWVPRTRPGCGAGSTPPWPTPRPARSVRSPRSTSPPAGPSAAAASCRSCPSIDGSRSAGPGSATAYQRTGANREAKLLQLTHAFETLGANRVEFKTHARNERSRTALAGIGATFEGVFRNHMIMPDGSIRDSAYFSVIAEEWPAVKAAAGGRPGALSDPCRREDARCDTAAPDRAVARTEGSP